MNQDIQVSGEGNTIRVFSGGHLRIGNTDISVSGEGNSVVVASSVRSTCATRTLRIEGREPLSVARGQIWAHGLLRVQVLSVSDGYARCLITDENGEAVKDEPVELAAWHIRRFYDYVGLAAPPKVRRGQVWQHHILKRRYQVISVRNGVARCLVTDLTGSPIKDGDGKARVEDVTTINMRYAYALVGGAS